MRKTAESVQYWQLNAEHRTQDTGHRGQMRRTYVTGQRTPDKGHKKKTHKTGQKTEYIGSHVYLWTVKLVVWTGDGRAVLLIRAVGAILQS